MTEIRNLLLLNDKVPIRLITKPYCKKCMNPVGEDVNLCNSCTEFPHPKISDWFFNRIVTLGIYKTYENKDYNNIPLNINSRMILRLKGTVQKNKDILGELFADGLFKLTNKYPFLLGDFTYLLIPPKDNPSEENQCKYFLNPFIDKLRQQGFNIENISAKLKRNKSIGKNKGKSLDDRFEDVRGVHTLNEINLQRKNVLILDDVVTSKSTIWDISRELKEKNAGEINVLTLGRNLLSINNNMEEDVSSNLNFYELTTYFSNLDNILESKNIEKVKIKESEIADTRIGCKTDKYNIEIDFENLILEHNCDDFLRRRYKNKSFCKHISKLFLYIKEQNGEEFAREKLYSIYKKLLYWNFNYK